MLTQTVMLNEMLVYMGVSVPNNIPEIPDIEIPDIPPISNFSKMSSSYNSAPPIYQHLHHTAIIQE